MPKLILHVGTHKTGTTAIQSFLEANTEALEEHDMRFPLFRVRWPEPVLPNRNGYFLNRAALHRTDATERYPDAQQVATCTQALRRQLEEDERAVILSDERLWFSAATRPGFWDVVRKLAEGIGFDDFEVIVYLRRQDELAESLWNQFVKATDKTETIGEYLARPQVQALCDYHRNVKALERAFGKRALRIGVFDRSKLPEGNVVHDFLHRLGLPARGDYSWPPRERTNERLSNNVVEVKRIINHSPAFSGMPNFFGPSLSAATEADTWSPKTTVIDDETRAAFIKPFEAGNRELARAYTGGKRLFAPVQPSARDLWQFDAESLLRDTVLVLSDTIARQQRQIIALEQRVAQLEGKRQPRREGRAQGPGKPQGPTRTR